MKLAPSEKYKIVVLTPAIPASRKKEGGGVRIFLRTLPRNPTYHCTDHILLLFFGQDLGDWPQLARELGKCGLYLTQPFAQSKIGEYGDVAVSAISC